MNIKKSLLLLLSLAIIGCDSNDHSSMDNETQSYKQITYSKLLDIVANSFVEQKKKYGELNNEYTYTSIVRYAFPEFCSKNIGNNFAIHDKLDQAISEISESAESVKSDNGLYSTYADMRVSDDYDYNEGILSLYPLNYNSVLLTKNNKSEIENKLKSGIFSYTVFRLSNLKNGGIPVKIDKAEASNLYQKTGKYDHIVCVQLFYNLQVIQNTTVTAQVDAVNLVASSLCKYNT